MKKEGNKFSMTQFEIKKLKRNPLTISVLKERKNNRFVKLVQEPGRACNLRN